MYQGQYQCHIRALDQGLPLSKIVKGPLYCNGAFPFLLKRKLDLLFRSVLISVAQNCDQLLSIEIELFRA